MTFEEVLKFAREHSFDEIKYKGVYDGMEVYKPLNTKPSFTGPPAYIIVKDGTPKFIFGQELIERFNP